jgi:hypothetical protein
MFFRLKLKVIVHMLPLVMLSAVPSAQAVKLWKWVDTDGKTHYSESKPPQAAKIEEKWINPDQNVIQVDSPPTSTMPAKGSSSSPNPVTDTSFSDNKTRKGLSAGGGAATTVPAPPPPVTPSPPPASTPPIPQPPIFPSPTPGGF